MGTCSHLSPCPTAPALPDAFPSSNPREMPETLLVLAELSTAQSKHV